MGKKNDDESSVIDIPQRSKKKPKKEMSFIYSYDMDRVIMVI